LFLLGDTTCIAKLVIKFYAVLHKFSFKLKNFILNFKKSKYNQVNSKNALLYHATFGLTLNGFSQRFYLFSRLLITLHAAEAASAHTSKTVSDIGNDNYNN